MSYFWQNTNQPEKVRVHDWVETDEGPDAAIEEAVEVMIRWYAENPDEHDEHGVMTFEINADNDEAVIAKVTVRTATLAHYDPHTQRMVDNPHPSFVAVVVKL